MTNLLAFCSLALLCLSAFAEPLQTTLNYHKINDQLLSSGQISPEQIPSLTENGIDLVINLTIETSEENAQEGFAITKQGIDYVHIPVVWETPTQENLNLFLGIMALARDQKVLVHCYANYRASAFVYLYQRLMLGVSDIEARADLDAVWSPEAWKQYPQWQTFIEAALNQRANQPPMS